MSCQRNSNLELLRIIAMLFIVSYHYGRHGVYTFEVDVFTFNRFFVSILEIGGQLGVSLFVLISAYFLSQKSFKSIRIIKIIMETWYYALLGFLFFVLILREFSFFEMIKSLLPMIFERYWFMTSFVLMLIFSPFLNHFIKGLSKQVFKSLLVVMLFIFGFVRTVFMVEMNYSNLIWFVFLYLVAAYIHQYQADFTYQASYYLKQFVFYYVVLVVIIIIFDCLGVYSDFFSWYASYFVKITSFILFFASVNLFIYFIKKAPFSNQSINAISKHSFAVYLIHDNDLFRNYLWRHILQTPKFQHSPYFLLHFLASIMFIFVLSYCIHFLSKRLVLDRLERKLNVFCQHLDKKIAVYIE